MGSVEGPDAKKAWFSASDTDNSEGLEVGGMAETAATVTPVGLVEAYILSAVRVTASKVSLVNLR